MQTWSVESLSRLDAARELLITALAVDGSPRPEVPIWMVCVGDRVFVRTWYRRTTGWFGHAVASGRARVRVLGVHADVRVHDVGGEPRALRDAVDAAYRHKYGGAGDSAAGGMLSADAVASTLELVAEQQE